MTLKNAQRQLKELLQKYHLQHSELMKALNILESLDQRNREMEAGVIAQHDGEDDLESEDDNETDFREIQGKQNIGSAALVPLLVHG